jgi:hypothetical protein
MQNIMSFIVTNPAIPLTVAIVVLLMYMFYLDHKIVLLTRGKNGASLEETIKECLASVSTIEEKNEFISKHALNLDERVSHAIRNVQTIRYKAFDQNGSNQSFSIALVNEKGSGVIITSLHSHERMSTFAKPITNYESTYDLTEEELAVLEDAKASHKTEIKM